MKLQQRFATRHKRLWLFWLIAIIGLVTPWLNQELKKRTTQTCEVQSIYDGDTMTVSCSGEKIKLRLYCIDSPEIQQKPWGHQSRDYLRSITPGQVRVVHQDTDRYGRVVAEVYAGERNLNQQMVRAGQAAVYQRYCHDPQFGYVEEQARQKGLGIWREDGFQQRPWEWRK